MRQIRPNKILGVAITEQALLIAEIVGTGEQRDLRRCAEFQFPEGTSLENLAALGRPLAHFLKQNGFTAKQMVVGLPTKWLLVKSKEVPPSTAASAATILRLQAESDFSSELADLVYDYAGQPDRRNSSTVLVMATLRNRCDQINEMAQSARLSIRAILPSMMALGAASQSLAGPKGLVAYLGNGELEFVVQKGAELQRIRHIALVGAASTAGGGGSAVAQPCAQEVAAELKRTLASFPQNGTIVEPKLVFWDGTNLGAADRQLIGERLGMPIEAYPLSALGLQSTQSNAVHCIPAIALALAGLDPSGPAIDFTHSRLAPPRETSTRRKIVWAAIIGGVILLAAGAGIVDTLLRASDAQKLQGQLNDLTPQIKHANAFEDHFAYVKKWYGSDPKFINALGHLTEAFPDDGSAWAINVEVRNDPKPAPTTQSAGPHPGPIEMMDNLKVQVTGKAVSWNIAQNIEDRLRSGEKFKNVSLLDLRGAGHTNEVSFSISFDYSGTEAPMVITKRERLYVIIVSVLLGLFLLNYLAIAPFLSYRAQIKTDLDTVTVNLENAQVLFNRQRNHEKEWKALLASSLKSTPSEAESQVLHSVRDWAVEAGLGLESLKPEHMAQDKDTTFQQIAFHASGNGSMASIARMLWRLETAPIPLHVNSVQVTPRKEATDDLTVQLTISTLCLNPEPEKPKAVQNVHTEENP